MKNSNFKDREQEIPEEIKMLIEEDFLKAITNSDVSIIKFAFDAIINEDKKNRIKIEPILGEFEESPNWKKLVIAIILGKLGNKKGYEPLLELLYDKDDNIRYWAIASLGWLKDERAFTHLIGLLNDKNPRIRVSLAFALGELGDERVVDVLLEFLRDKDVAVKIEAIKALGNFKDKNIILVLEDVITNEPENDKIFWNVKNVAQKSIEKIKTSLYNKT
jgi:HEAT repeat protein